MKTKIILFCVFIGCLYFPLKSDAQSDSTKKVKDEMFFNFSKQLITCQMMVSDGMRQENQESLTTFYEIAKSHIENASMGYDYNKDAFLSKLGSEENEQLKKLIKDYEEIFDLIPFSKDDPERYKVQIMSFTVWSRLNEILIARITRKLIQ